MAACEKCWGDAFVLSQATGRSQTSCYLKILAREETPCSPREQAGQFWDEENQCDRRSPVPKGALERTGNLCAKPEIVANAHIDATLEVG
jgi:hypothetical protein